MILRQTGRFAAGLCNIAHFGRARSFYRAAAGRRQTAPNWRPPNGAAQRWKSGSTFEQRLIAKKGEMRPVRGTPEDWHGT